MSRRRARRPHPAAAGRAVASVLDQARGEAAQPERWARPSRRPSGRRSGPGLPGILALAVALLLSAGGGGLVAGLGAIGRTGHPDAVDLAVWTGRSGHRAGAGPRLAILSGPAIAGARPGVAPTHQVLAGEGTPARSAPSGRPGAGSPAPSPDRAAGAPTPAADPATNPPAWSCAAALAYLPLHAAPGFAFVCPGDAFGHQAMTCDDVPGVCPGFKEIVIADPCQAAYMNEAWNSLVLDGLAEGPWDPFGYCPAWHY